MRRLYAALALTAAFVTGSAAGHTVGFQEGVSFRSTVISTPSPAPVPQPAPVLRPSRKGAKP